MLRRGTENISHYAGLQSCGSPWACPTCASKIAAARVVEVGKAVSAHQANGGGAAMLTQTFAHTRADRLETLLEDQQRAWELFRQSRTWRAAKQRYGIEWIRFRETTWGADNGWHPHFHSAFLTARPLTDDERRELERDLQAAWLAALKGVGRSGLSGIALRLDAWNAHELADYLTKQGNTSKSWGMPEEVAGGAFKKGQPHKRFTPWDLLALAADGDADAYHLWRQYEGATSGRRTCFWSKGLRRRLLGVEEAPTDQELAEAEVGGEDVAGLYGPARRAIWRVSHKGVALLEASEKSNEAAWDHLRQHAPSGSWFACGPHDQAEEEAS